MKKLLFILSMLASPCFGEEQNPNFITRDELVDIIYAEDIEGLQNLFAETHSRFASGELPLNYLRTLNTWLIVTDPKVLEVSSAWHDQMPDSIYAKVVVAFQARNLAWGVRGGKFAHETYPDALAGFNTLNEQAFTLAYEAYLEAPGYIPASDAVINFNGTMQVFWRGEIESIIADTMELHPNFGTVLRAGSMHLPQWRGEGPSGVERLCETYVPHVTPQKWLNVETCIAYIIWTNSFDQELQKLAALILADIDEEGTGIEFEVMGAIINANRVDRKDDVVAFLLREEDRFAQDVILAGRFARWGVSSLGGQLELSIQNEAYDAARKILAYDPYNAAALEVIARGKIEITAPGEIREPEAQSLNEFHQERLDLSARELMASPYDPTRWAALGSKVLSARGFQQSLPFFTNAMAYGLQKADVSQNYVFQLAQHWENLERSVSRGQTTAQEIETTKKGIICEVNRITHLNALLCSYDARYYADECNPYSVSTMLGEYTRQLAQDFTTLAQNEGAFCNQDPDADFEQTSYFPVEADVAQFINHQRPTARE